MATITQSEVEIYLGAGSTIGSKVGNTIVTSGASTAIQANATTLGVNLAPGTQYSARARCTNSEEYTSEWTNYYSFKTLAQANYVSKSATSNSITFCGEIVTTAAVTVTECGFYYSTSETGVNAVKVPGTPQEYGQPGITATGLTEHTMYYMIPYAKDSDGREYKDDWANCEEIMTSYSQATINQDLTATYNSVASDFDIGSTTAITAITATLQAVGGGDTYTIDCDPSMPTNSVNFVNGDDDSEGETITILPNTAYRVTIAVTNSAGDTTNSATITTQQQEVSTIAISSISNITPNSCTVNLTFGSGE